LENDKSMTMLYRVAPGALQETHYGLTLARIVPLPPGLVDRATDVAHQLEAHLEKQKKASETILREKRRKLILSLKEHLVQAHNGMLEGEVLSAWLMELKKEFVNRMTALEAEAASASQQSDEDQDMREQSVQEVEEERPSTYASQPSVMSVDDVLTFRGMSEASTIRAVSDNEG
jgi:DNA mismatch repair protein MSH4